MDERTLRTLQNQLREELLPWLLLPLGLSGLVLSMANVRDSPPPSRPALGLLILACVAVVWVLRRRYYTVAAWIANIGTIALITLAWQWFPQANPHLALLFPVVASAVTLGPRGCAVTSAGTGLLLARRLIGYGPPADGVGPLITELAVMASTAYVLCISQRSQRAMVAWAWQGYQQAQQHLEDARDRQVRLKQALEDLALATSETIRLNEMLSTARRAVDEARRAKEEFVANVSHELRTPLNMIIGFSDMILESPQIYSRRLPPALLADVAAIKRNSQHLASLVDDVLDLSEAEAGFMQLTREWVPIHEVAREAAEAVSALFAKKGLELLLQAPESPPEVYCDRTRIRQVILNLLSNAGRFTERGRCELCAVAEDGVLTVSISDTGPGMPPERVGRVFEPFQQGDPSIRRRYGGTGLGLAISKRFVELHGGKIWLDSHLGSGTTVYFTLPLGGDPQDGEAPHRRWFGAYAEYEPRTRPSSTPPITVRPRLLVLEEGSALRSLASRFLDEFEILPVAAAQDLAQSIREQMAVAVLINDATEGLTPEVLAGALQSDFDVPLISCRVPERRSAFTSMGAQDYLVKPIDRRSLLSSVCATAPQARSILVADDDPEARQLFRRMLASAPADYTVLYAENGESALALLRDKRPDLILLDLVMPDLDGFAVLEAKRAEPAIRDIPVIVISAKDPQRDPIVSRSLHITRPAGLSGRDLMIAVQAVTRCLKPRLGPATRPETPGV